MVVVCAIAVASTLGSAPMAAAEVAEQDRYVGPWHVGMRVDPATGAVDHVASVDDGDYRLAFRCIANKPSIVLFSRDQMPPFEPEAKLDVIVRADRGVPKTGSARATRPDLLTIEDYLIRFEDIADAQLFRIRMRSEAGDRIDAAFDVSQARQALADVVKQCPDMMK